MGTFIVKGPPLFAGASQTVYEKYVYKSTTKRKKPRGANLLLSPTAYESLVQTDERTPSYNNNSIGHPVVTPLGSYSSPSGISTAQVKAQCQTKLLNKIKGEKWNLGTFLGELPTTQKYFRTALTEIVRLYKAVKRGNMREIKRLAKRGRAYLRKRGFTGAVYDGSGKASGKWLEWRYAICPIVYDLDDMMAALYDSQFHPIIRRTASGVKEESFEAGIRTMWADEGLKTDISLYARFSYQGRSVLYYSINPNAAAFKRLGLINFGATLWELTPLSFVVDWVIPVGDVIGHLDAMAGVTVFSGTYSTRCHVESHVRSYKTEVWDRGVRLGYKAGGPQLKVADHYTRIRDDLKSPSFKFTTSATGKQLIDAVALARSILSK